MFGFFILALFVLLFDMYVAKFFWAVSPFVVMIGASAWFVTRIAIVFCPLGWFAVASMVVVVLAVVTV